MQVAETPKGMRSDTAQSAPRTRQSGRILLWLMGAGVAWLLLIGYAERNLAGTRLWIAGATFDAGNLKPGAIVRHRAWVINPSLR